MPVVIRKVLKSDFKAILGRYAELKIDNSQLLDLRNQVVNLRGRYSI